MTNDRLDDPLKALEAALAVEPSPAFAASVRARVAESGNRPMWLGWQGLAAAAVIMLAAFGAVVWRASVGDVRTVPHGAEAEFTGVPVAGASGPAVVDRATAAARPAPIDAPNIRTAVARAPEVLVPPDQAIALNRLLAGLRERRTADSGAAEASGVVIEELPQIIPVRLEPIKIDPLVPNSPPSGGRERDR